LKTNNNKIAVLLAAYNGMDFIEEQLGSILKQSKVDVHLFVSVDLSSDGTHELCEEMASKHSNISLLPYGERFGGAAKNFYRLIRDVDFSGFEYVALADQDDVWLENKLARAVECIEDRGLDAYSSDVMAFWADGAQKLVKKSYAQTQYDYFFESAGPGCTYVFAAGAIDKFKTFADKHGGKVQEVELHDWMIYAFFRASGLKWHIDNCGSMLYRQHASNQFGSNNGLSSFIKRFTMVKDKWYRNEVEKIYNLVGQEDSRFSLNRPFLVVNFYKLRRRLRDKLFIVFFLASGVF